MFEVLHLLSSRTMWHFCMKLKTCMYVTTGCWYFRYPTIPVLSIIGCQVWDFGIRKDMLLISHDNILCGEQVVGSSEKSWALYYHWMLETCIYNQVLETTLQNCHISCKLHKLNFILFYWDPNIRFLPQTTKIMCGTFFKKTNCIDCKIIALEVKNRAFFYTLQYKVSIKPLVSL
jgi:hypothetical protein